MFVASPVEENGEMEETRQKFSAFPFTPYSIQIDFMNALYDSLDKGGIAMLESPTGTGKTLSIICSALQWLVDRKQRKNNDNTVDTHQNGTTGDDDEPDWLRNIKTDSPKKKVKLKKRHGFRSKKRDKTGLEESFNDLFNHFREIEADYNVYGSVHSNPTVKGAGEMPDDKEFLVEEYESEDEKNGLSKRKSGGNCGVSSSSEGEEEGNESSDEDEEADFKIYFCSRTHSQLSQFVKELKKTSFANDLKVACLGSRKNFCINEDVLKLGNSTLINERCLDLQKNKKTQVSKKKEVGGKVRKTKASSGCPMLTKHKLQKQFRNEMLDQGALDIEDLVRLGGNLGTCPYYGSRSMVPAADLVVLPYQSLLSKSSRESLGLSLKNSVVIIDEAHNLADSLISMYDSKVTLSQLELVNSSLRGYFERFRNLLGPGNRRHIQTLMILTQAFIQTLSDKSDTNFIDSSFHEQLPTGSECSLQINEFVFSLNIDNINLVKLLQYIKDSNMIHKASFLLSFRVYIITPLFLQNFSRICSQVSGFGDKIITSENDSIALHEGSILSSFRALAGLLLSLTNHDSDGRIILSRKTPGGYLKYVMLTGEKIFHEIVDEAHACVLAGGTLQPIEETRARLFPWLPPHQLHLFSCGHIISPDNILPISVSHGPTGQSMDFSYNSRSTPTMVGELGLLICNLVGVIPQGIVVFFSSFDYEEHVYSSWKESGILNRMMKKKRVFREPRKSTEIETVLKEYKESVDEIGAVLFAVVGGKISEGINFSDGMGRCIVMVGLPYPSPSDIELIERVKYIDSLGDMTKKSNTPLSFSGDAHTGFEILRSCKHRGREYYENICMKAVNQSIGRAIRHIDDYAAILLVDTRYRNTTIDSLKKNISHPTNKLPNWIKDRLMCNTRNYGEVHRLLHLFFKSHKKPLRRRVERNKTLREQQKKLQMLIRKTIHKTKKILTKSLQKFKSFIFGGYRKLKKAPSLKLFNNSKMQQLDNFYKEFCEQWDSGDIESNKSVNGDLNNNNNNNNNKTTNTMQDQKSVVINSPEDKKDIGCSKSNRHDLEQKMKELEMMDMKDEEQVLDIEEVLHYYSLLTSPIYQDLVDKFFTDMYSDFYVPNPPIRSNSVNSSMRRLGPLNMNRITQGKSFTQTSMHKNDMDYISAVVESMHHPSQPKPCLVSPHNHPIGSLVYLPQQVNSSPVNITKKLNFIK
ncbi:hypothetical protein LXL04_008481 [Taraxacum kok-saghyz]